MENVGIICDFLLNKSEETFVLEQLMALYDDVTLYTLSHQKGNFQAPIELAPIYSTYLSNKIKQQSDIQKYFYLIPHALKLIKLRKQHQAVIILNSGCLTGLELNPDLYNLKIELNLSWGDYIPHTGLKAKIFRSFFEKAIHRNSFEKFSMRMHYLNKSSSAQKTYVCANFDQFELKENALRSKFIFSNTHSYPSIAHLQERITVFDCLAHLEPEVGMKDSVLFDESFCFIIHGYTDYYKALRAKACGVMVYNTCKKSADFYTEISIPYLKHETLDDQLREIILSKHRYDPKKMRREALKFNAQNFKRKFLKNCEKLFAELNEQKNEPMVFHSHENNQSC